MLIDRYAREDVAAGVPELAAEIDPVLKKLDELLDDDELYRQVRADFGKRYRWTLVHGRHSTPVEVRLAPADPQTPVSVELQRTGRAGQGQPGAALVLPGGLPCGARWKSGCGAGSRRCTRRRCMCWSTGWHS
jgi:hypothetical protein